MNVVLNAQWALYQVLTRLGLRPDAVLGHSSGEMLALSAGGVFQTDRTLERKLGRLGAIMSGSSRRATCPRPGWSPWRLTATASRRLCRDLGATGVDVAMDNCPHQVVLAVPLAEHCRGCRPPAPREYPLRGTAVFACLSHAELPPGRRARSPSSSTR